LNALTPVEETEEPLRSEEPQATELLVDYNFWRELSLTVPYGKTKKGASKDRPVENALHELKTRLVT
jgi:hypothetical protein